MWKCWELYCFVAGMWGGGSLLFKTHQSRKRGNQFLITLTKWHRFDDCLLRSLGFKVRGRWALSRIGVFVYSTLGLLIMSVVVGDNKWVCCATFRFCGRKRKTMLEFWWRLSASRFLLFWVSIKGVFGAVTCCRSSIIKWMNRIQVTSGGKQCVEPGNGMVSYLSTVLYSSKGQPS